MFSIVKKGIRKHGSNVNSINMGHLKMKKEFMKLNL